jgi:formate dehydrogenase iron-sulfur subunit
MPKAILIDTTRCTACRGCQVSCKEWKNLPPVATRQRGTHQNPPDLTHANFKLVRFSEHLEGDTVKWYFFPDQCRHCLEPPCKFTIDGYVEGGAIQDEATGAVVYTEKTKKVPFEEVRASCPYNIPRQAKDGRIVKCTMCIDRVSNGLVPACVKVCPTGTMNFGERDAMLNLANERLAKLKGKYPKAQLLDADQIRVVFLVVDDPARYYKFAVASADIGVSRKLALRRMLKPAAGLFRAVNLG